MSITANDNTEQVLNELEQAYDRMLNRIGLQAVTYAKKELSRPKPHGNGITKPNVDTGLLRSSLTYAISGESANITTYTDDDGNQSGTYSGNAPSDKDKATYVGTNVEYGSEVELGGLHSKAYPYLRPAATEHSETYKRIAEDELKGK